MARCIRLRAVILAVMLVAIAVGTLAPQTADARGDGVDLAVSFSDNPDSAGLVLEVTNYGDVVADGVRVEIGLRGYSVDAHNNDDSPIHLPVGKLVPVAGTTHRAIWEVGRMPPASRYRIPSIIGIRDNGNLPDPRPSFDYYTAVVSNVAPKEPQRNLRNNHAHAFTRRTSGIPLAAADAVVEATANDLGGNHVSFTVTAETRGYDDHTHVIGAVVDLGLTPGLAYSAHTITRTSSTGVVSPVDDAGYDPNSGQWNIGDFPRLTASYDLTLTTTIADGAVRGEECLTAQLSTTSQDGISSDGSSSLANNVARACLGSPVISGGQLSLLTWYDCIGNTDYPCDRANNANSDGFELVVAGGASTVTSRRVAQPNDVIIHVREPSGRHATGGGEVFWSTGRSELRRRGVELGLTSPPVDSGWGDLDVEYEGSVTAPHRASYSGPGTLDAKYLFSGNRYSFWEFDASGVGSAVSEYFGNEDFPIYFEFTQMGTYTFDYAVNATHCSGTDGDASDDVVHSDAETYTFHVGPMADLGVSDGGASTVLGGHQVALTVSAVNNGPDDAGGVVVELDPALPDGVAVVETIASDGTYANGRWDLGEFRRTDRRLGARLPGAATLTLVLEGANAEYATAGATIYHDEDRPYAVCVTNSGGTVARDEEEHCVHNPGFTWHEIVVYDHRGDNDKAELKAWSGRGLGPAAGENTPAIAVTWQPVAYLDGTGVSHYQVWRSDCDSRGLVQVTDNVPATLWVDLDVMAGETYCYQVRAVSVYGAQGPFSRVMERTAALPVTIAEGAPGRPELSAAPLDGQPRERILLKWEKPVEHGWPITEYELQVSDRSGGPWEDVDPQPYPYDEYYIYPSLDQERLTGGTRKYFRIRATNERGPSDWSRVVSATTDRADLAGPPVNVLARPAALPDDGSVIIVWWEPPAYDGGADITGYEIQWSPNGTGGWSYAGRVDVDTFAFKNTGLGYGTTRYYRVAAHNSRGRGAWSDPPVAAVTSAKEEGASLPGAPTNLKLEAGSQWIRASWVAPASDGGSPIKGYRVQYREGRSGAWETLSAFPSGTSTPLHGTPNGVEYQVRVAAVNGAGTGPYTTPQSATPYYPPGTPRNLSVTPGNGRLTAKWDPPEIPGSPNLNGYSVQYKQRDASDWIDWRHSGTRTEATITGLTNGTTYQVRVASLSAPLLLAAAKGKEIDYTTPVSATPVAPSQ